MMEKNSIEVADLCKSFGKPRNGLQVKALDHLSFACQAGFIYGLIGPNGAGKTTCLRILSGVFSPTSGIVKIVGINLDNDLDKARQKVGCVLTTAQPYNHLTPKEFLFYCGRLARTDDLAKKVDRLIQQLGIEQFQDRRCGELSTGMKQRVAIARSLIHGPEVLIFDEPTVGLDILGRREVIDLLVTIKSMVRTVIISTHIPEEAEKLCDYLLIINKGKLIEKGTPSDILANSGANNIEEAFIRLLKA